MKGHSAGANQRLRFGDMRRLEGKQRWTNSRRRYLPGETTPLLREGPPWPQRQVQSSCRASCRLLEKTESVKKRRAFSTAIERAKPGVNVAGATLEFESGPLCCISIVWQDWLSTMECNCLFLQCLQRDLKYFSCRKRDREPGRGAIGNRMKMDDEVPAERAETRLPQLQVH